ncbi:MAG: abortive infection bacteriophage resistance protein [Candidatus Endobugula sp.]|jgi:abortive infection bacteriophage resistance protein
MGKSVTTVEDQIARLHERGMTLDLKEEKVKEILLDIGYYRLGFYWNPFEIDKAHNFKQGTKFSDALDLYYLDVDLRHLLLKYLNRIEIHFTTQLIYFVSNHYKHSSTWFADPEVVTRWWLDSLDKYYDDKFKRNNKVIKEHHLKYINHKYAPAWKTLEFFSFGNILTLYKSLKSDDCKKLISNNYNIRNLKTFTSYLTTLLTLRNLCAHGGQLFDFQTPKGIPNIPALKLKGDERHSLSGVCQLIYYFLDQVSLNRRKELEKSIELLLAESAKNETIKEIIRTKMHFISV